jgi:hypothetical protein
MADLARPDRLQVMLSPDEFAALDNWRFEKRMPSRAAAVRELLRRGLGAEGFLAAEQNSRSGDFGLLETTPRPDGNGDGRG